MKNNYFNPEHISNLIVEDSVVLHLTGYTHSGEWRTITPTINSNVKNGIIDIICNQLNWCDGLEEKSYNIIGAEDDIVEVTNVADFNESWDKIKQSFAQPTISSRVTVNHYDFFTYELDTSNNKKMYVLRRINKVKAIKSGILGKLFDGEFSKIETSNLLGIDNAIDLLIYEDKIWVFKHIALERIFKLKDEFKEKAKEVLENKIFTDKIKNFDNLKERALKNGNYVKRLAKLHDSSQVTLFLDKIDKTEIVIEKFALDIEVENGVLIYRDETQVGNFINLMQDSYYQTLIGEENGIDENR
ncbi:Kiwa anti-phage protein KwaB-like domain-containing protein [Lactobacillus paragasseri]|uniref:Kiwa anti-phage protein KwaB-like domain-containing protein n=1 Tax=Lactobacillus paragasseri TaxID=2107999 RepID=UPI0028D716F8|nr:Kiwa anti-phage protein KwaB-like domain-containing protein [Lactobacillus paragasseri]